MIARLPRAVRLALLAPFLAAPGCTTAQTATPTPAARIVRLPVTLPAPPPLGVAGPGRPLMSEQAEQLRRSGVLDLRNVSSTEWLPDGSAAIVLATDPQTDEATLTRLDVATGQRTKLLSQADMKADGAEPDVEWFRLSPDGGRMIFSSEGDPSFSSQGDYFLYDLATKQFKRLTRIKPGSEQRHIDFLPPDGRRIVFERDHDLYLMDLASGTEKRLTTDGSPTRLNGTHSWVYEEEIYNREGATGWKASPDGRMIAFTQADQSPVQQFSITMYDTLYTTQQTTYYPKVGTVNPTMKLFTLDLASGKRQEVETGVGKDDYLPRVWWTPSGQVAFARQNRPQTTLELKLADPTTGKSRTVISETIKSGWWEVDGSIDDVRFLPNNLVTWRSERDGWSHLYLYDLTGKLVRPLTPGNYDLAEDAIHAVDGKRIWFSAHTPDPREEQLFSVSMTDGKPARQETRGVGVHGISMNEQGTAYVDEFQSPTQPKRWTLRTTAGREVAVLEANPAARFLAFRTMQRRDFKLPAADGKTMLDATLMLPANFDSTRRYPVLFYLYGGPNSKTVSYNFLVREPIMTEVLTRNGYLVCSVDNRGTGAHGSAFRHAVNRQLGVVEADDQAAAAASLAKLPYVDSNRMGIWGWSYGGYMTIRAMLQHPETYKMGISVAPVTDWRYYDTVYTERYMQTPATNAAGFQASSLLPLADRLQGKLLLIHGLADDNVHFQNAAVLMRRWEVMNKPFESMVYPELRHGLTGVSSHRVSLMLDFIQRTL